MITRILKSKTMWFGVTLFLSSFSGILEELAKNHTSLTLKVIAAVIVGLRAVTTTALFNKGE